jgi:hypothetical protein
MNLQNKIVKKDRQDPGQRNHTPRIPQENQATMFTSTQLYFSLFFLLLSFTNASRPFGNLGPEGTVIFLNGFHFLSGNASAEISADITVSFSAMTSSNA